MFPNGPYNHPTGSFTVPMVPPGIDPQAEPQVTVNFNCAWLPFVRGALTQLLLESTWTVTGDDLGFVQSQVWRLINAFGDGGCDTCDCLRFNNDTGTIQRLMTVGPSAGTWVDVAKFTQVDPRTQGHVDPPWTTPPSGQSGACLSGANIEQYFATMMGDAATKMGLIAEVGALLVEFENYLALPLGPIGEVVEIATSMAVGAMAAGATVMGTAFDTATQTSAFNGIRCLFECNSGSDGSYSAEAVALIKSEFYASIDSWVSDSAENVLWRIMFAGFLDSEGPNGLTLLGKASGIVAYDCSDCSCGWSHPFLGGFGLPSIATVPYGTYDSGADKVIGTQYYTVSEHYGDLVFTFPSEIHITHFEVIFERTAPIVTGFSSSVRSNGPTNLSYDTGAVAAGVNVYRPITDATFTVLTVEIVNDATDNGTINKVILYGDGTDPLPTWPQA